MVFAGSFYGHRAKAHLVFELTTDRLAQLVEHRTAVREVAGSNPERTNTHGLTEEKVLHADG